MDEARLKRLSKRTWAQAKRSAKGYTPMTYQGVEGYSALKSIAPVIRETAKKEAEKLTQGEVGFIRDYLRASKNMVSLGQVSPGVYRTFIANEWQDASLAVLTSARPNPYKAIDDRARKLTPEEAGETREESPVVTVKGIAASTDDPLRWLEEETGSSTPIGRGSMSALRWLYNQGGEFHKTHKERWTELWEDEALHAPSAFMLFKHMRDRGLVTIERISRQENIFRLTHTGKLVALLGPVVMSYEERVHHLLQELYEDTGQELWDAEGHPVLLLRELAEHLPGMRGQEVGSGLRALADDGSISLETSESGHVERFLFELEWEPLIEVKPWEVEPTITTREREPVEEHQPPVTQEPMEDEEFREFEQLLSQLREAYYTKDDAGLAEVIALGDIAKVLEKSQSGLVTPLRALADIEAIVKEFEDG